MNLCVIPARGGSKRIPRKNIKHFIGKPIIAYSIEAALASGCFDQVVVSTDDEEIAKVSEEFGAKVPFIRPRDLSGDFVGTTPVVEHAVKYVGEVESEVKNVCCLYATAPFVTPSTLEEAYQLWQNSTADYCFSVTKFEFPIQRSLQINSENRVEMIYPEYFDTRSQDLEETYHDAGQFYWGKAGAFKENLKIFSNVSIPYIIPSYLVQDIDTIDDWIRAESMYKALYKSRSL